MAQIDGKARRRRYPKLDDWKAMKHAMKKSTLKTSFCLSSFCCRFLIKFSCSIYFMSTTLFESYSDLDLLRQDPSACHLHHYHLLDSEKFFEIVSLS